MLSKKIVSKTDMEERILTLFKFESIQYFSLYEQFSLSVLEANFAHLKKLVFFFLNRLLAASLYSPHVNSFLFLFHKNNAYIRIVKQSFLRVVAKRIGIFEGKLNLEYACFVLFEENSMCTPVSFAFHHTHAYMNLG